MTDEVEGFEVNYDETMGYWYIVHRRWKGNMFDHLTLAEHYESQQLAEEACAEMRRTL